MNKVFLIGNLTRDPELTETPSGIAMCRFSIAVNRNYTDADGERQVDFFNCVAWRGLAENISRFTAKGKKVGIVGSVETRSYEDNQGNKRSVVDVIVQDCEFLTPKTETGEAQPMQAKKKPTLEACDDDSSDIPF